MITTTEMRPGTLRHIATGLDAPIGTGVVSGIWGGLLTANLASTPAMPWSAPVLLLAAFGLARVAYRHLAATQPRRQRID